LHKPDANAHVARTLIFIPFQLPKPQPERLWWQRHKTLKAAKRGVTVYFNGERG